MCKSACLVISNNIKQGSVLVKNSYDNYLSLILAASIGG
jgi:hypothetical protein